MNSRTRFFLRRDEHTNVRTADSSSGVYCKDGIDLIKVLHCKKEKGCLKSTNASEREVKDSSELFAFAGKNELDVVIDLAPFGNPVTGKIVQSALSNGIDCVLANKAPLVSSYHLLKKLVKTSGAKFAYVVFVRYSYHSQFTHKTQQVQRYGMRWTSCCQCRIT